MRWRAAYARKDHSLTKPSYEDVITSPAFLEDLASLNHAIAEGLTKAGEPVAINGNVCYAHMQENFHESELSPAMEPKRRVLHRLALESSCFAEVGVAGGHAALLALHSNPDMKYIGIDLGQRLRESWPPVDIYVPIAFRWFESRFPGRVRLYLSPAVDGLKRAAQDRPFGPIDLLHLDAQKKNRIAELEAAWPGLADRCFLIQGDNRNGHVQVSSARLIEQGRARPVNLTGPETQHSANFGLLETGPDVASQTLSLDGLAHQRILLCVCHQDDETLFGGSLLAHLKGRAEVVVACFFRPAANRRDTNTREAAMQHVCDLVGATRVQLPFAVEGDHPRLSRFIRMPADEKQLEPEIIRPLRRHPLFGLLTGSAYALMKKHTPSTIITHNRVGEYGHIEHVLLHHAVSQAAARFSDAQLLTFGVNIPSVDLTVPCLRDQKNKMYDCYMPQWNGRRLYDFSLQDETFVRVDLPENA